jgi:hypothetical protein
MPSGQSGQAGPSPRKMKAVQNENDIKIYTSDDRPIEIFYYNKERKASVVVVIFLAKILSHLFISTSTKHIPC